MVTISHEKDEEGRVRIKAQGVANDNPFFWEAVLEASIDKNGVSHISKSQINTCGIEDPLLNDLILDAVHKDKGVHGEPPLIVDNN
jgi:hypothetical protein